MSRPPAPSLDPAPPPPAASPPASWSSGGSPLAPSTTALSAGEQALVLQAVEGAARAAVGGPVRLGRARRHAVQGRWAFVTAPVEGAAGTAYAVLLSRSEAGWSVVAAGFGEEDRRQWASLYGAPVALFVAQG